MAQYLAELSARGLHRDRGFIGAEWIPVPRPALALAGWLLLGDYVDVTRLCPDSPQSAFQDTGP